MRSTSIAFFIFTFLAISCNQNQEIRLELTNPLDLERNDASLLLSKEKISQWIRIPDGQVPVLIQENGDPVPSQLDDLDRDGEWDELFALTDMEAGGRTIVTLKFIAPEDLPAFEPRTNLRLGANQPGYPELKVAERLEGVTYSNHGRTGKVYQMEGPAWENDRVGFRNYLDQRNGMDIFGKLAPRMVMDSVGVAGRQSYHDPDEWGMDVLMVGTSLGSGSTAYIYRDSMYRVGDNGSGSYTALIEGSQRSRLILSYTNWKVEDMAYGVVHQIDIVAGRRCFESLVTYSGGDASLDLVTGIVNIKSDSLHVLGLNETFSGLFTHDHQSEDSTLLAMALIVPKNSLKRYGETRETGEGITQTYYVQLEAGPGKPVPYRFYSLWEKEDPRWASPEEITRFLTGEADRWANPVLVEPYLD